MCITNYIYESIHILTILNIECIELTTVGMLGIHYPEPLHVERIGNPAPNSITLHVRPAKKEFVSFQFQCHKSQTETN